MCKEWDWRVCACDDKCRWEVDFQQIAACAKVCLFGKEKGILVTLERTLRAGVLVVLHDPLWFLEVTVEEPLIQAFSTLVWGILTVSDIGDSRAG